MPVFFQHPVNQDTRLGIWKIEENEDFFRGNVPLHREVTHPHKRLQHLAGRFLLQYLFPDFPYELIRIADTRKPFLPGEQYHFSISHCGDYAAAIVSRSSRVGVDVEVPVPRILRIADKFLSPREKEIYGIPANPQSGNDYLLPTICWSAKEAVFKWYGEGAVDFRSHIQLGEMDPVRQIISCTFAKTGAEPVIHFKKFEGLVLAWVIH